MLVLVLFLRILCLLLPTTIVALPLNPDSELNDFAEARRDIGPKKIGFLPAHPQRRSHEPQRVAASIHRPRAVVPTSQSLQSTANLTINRDRPFTATVSFDAFIDINQGRAETPVGIEVRATLYNCYRRLMLLLVIACGHGR